MNNNVCFTCLSQHSLGFTGQLLVFDFMYRLGLALDYRYLHTPLSAPRSSDAIYNFLGINQQFTESAPHNIDDHYSTVTIVFNQLIYKHRPESFDEMKRLVRKHVDKRAQRIDKRRPILAVFRLDKISQLSTRPPWFLSNWRIALERPEFLHPRMLFSRTKSWLTAQGQFTLGQTVQKMWRMNKDAQQQGAGSFDFRGAFEEKQATIPSQQLFASDKVRLLVHIRKGDTAVIKTPWNTYQAIAREREHLATSSYLESDELAKTNPSYVQLSEYENFLRSLSAQFSGDLFSTIVSSDGFERSFQLMLERWDWYGFSAEQKQQMTQHALNYDQEQFSPFWELPNTSVIVGETDENLFTLIESAFQAHIIVCGMHQRMLPKLMAVYANTENFPLMIFVHKIANAEEKLQKFAFLNEDAPIITFHLENDSMQNLAHQISRFANKRNLLNNANSIF